MIRPRIAVPLLVGAAGVGLILWQCAAEVPSTATAERAAPRDADDWADLGAERLDAGDAAEATRAYRRAVDLAPDMAWHWSGLGEALAMRGSDDRVPDDAAAAFRRAIAIDPADPRARYFLALRRHGDGDAAGAIDAWLALLANMPAGTPWEADVVRQIERAGAASGIAVASRIAAARPAQPRPPRAIQPLARPPA